MPFKRLIGKDTSWADLCQVAAELVFKDPVLMPAEIYVIVGGENVKVGPSGVIAVEAHAPVALYASVHLMVKERAKVLVPVRALPEPVAPAYVPCHECHVLKMALSSLVADRAVVRVAAHHPLYDVSSKGLRLRVVDRDPRSRCRRRHAGHYNTPFCVALILELLDRALAARAYGVHGRVPAEVRKVEAQRKAGVQEVLPVVHLVRLVFDIYLSHSSPYR